MAARRSAPAQPLPWVLLAMPHVLTALLLGFLVVGCEGRSPPTAPEEEPSGGGAGAPFEEESIPNPSFPWPPPIPTSRDLIPDKLLLSSSPGITLGQVSNRLTEALQTQGYREMNWFQIPQGFALVSHLERINPDGTPAPSPYRWVGDDEVTGQRIDLKLYLRRLGLSHVPPGRFRVIVFFVTSAPVLPKGTVTREEARDWLKTGALSLDEDTASKLFTRRHQAQVFVYEFSKSRSDGQATFLEHSALLATDHLKAAGILGALGG